jgi:hypothetical protein
MVTDRGENVSRIEKFALGTILAHLAIAVVHGGAHKNLFIGLSANQEFFVWAVIIAVPLISVLLLLMKLRRAGGLFLFLSMAASFVFGTWNHFLVRGADNVASTHPTRWGLTFRVTASLLFLTEALGSGLGIALTR